MNHNITLSQTKTTWDFSATIPGDLIVCYHNNCMDGILAGGYAFYALRNNLAPNAKSHMLPVTYDGKLPFDPAQHPKADVYFVDFCPTAEQLRMLLGHKLNSITVYDHHQTGLEYAKEVARSFDKETTDTVLKMHFDSTHSGTGLVVKHLVGVDQLNIDECQTVEYAERFDLWKHKGELKSNENYLANSFSVFRRTHAPAISVAAKVEDYNQRLAELTSTGLDVFTDMRVGPFTSLIEIGMKENEVMEGIARTALASSPRNINGIRFLLVEAPGSVIPAATALVHELWPRTHFIIFWQARGEGVKLSLRQGPQAGYDMTHIAKRLDPNGGGHAGAAGCFIACKPEELLDHLTPALVATGVTNQA